MKKCLNCEIEKESTEMYGSGLYCSKSCATSYSKRGIKWTAEQRERAIERMEKSSIARFGELKEFHKKCFRCLSDFSVKERELKHPQKEKYFCSKLCACSRPQKEETKLKIAESVRSTIRKNHGFNPDIEKTCPLCENQFVVKYCQRKTVCCSRPCSRKLLGKDPEYVANIKKRARERVESGNHVGWKSRNILSYPEKFFINVLKKNGFEGQFKTNFPYSRSNTKSCYFLDFYFEDIKFDLEIDGKQHEYEERKKSDKARDDFLTSENITVHRIKWVSISNDNGKKHMEQEIKKLLEKINEAFKKHLIPVT